MRAIVVGLRWLLVLFLSSVPALGAETVRERVLLERVDSPELGEVLGVYVYLPPGYAAGGRYPVVYMHDGAEVFSGGRRERALPAVAARTAPVIWRAGAVLDALFDRAPEASAIVVAIDSEDRAAHFSPWEWSPAHAARGRAYMDFIVRTLKPAIDARYRTRPGRADTAMLGASFGGMITLYGVLKYPEVFSKGAVLSPVFTPEVLERQFDNYIRLRGPLEPVRLYLDIGAKEPARVRRGLAKIARALHEAEFDPAAVRARLAPRGTHEVISWRERFPVALAWLFDWRV